MRRAEKEITGRRGLLEVIDRCKVCRLGLRAERGVYIVPLNFGYRWAEELVLYFHGAKTGYKLELMERDPSAGFEMDCGHQLVEAETACAFGYRYASIIGQGTLSPVEDEGEKRLALERLMVHQTGREFSITAEMAEGVAVLKLVADTFTGKGML